MNFVQAVTAAFAFVLANLPQIETLAQRVALDVAAVYALLLAFYQVVAPYFIGAEKASAGKAKLLSVFNSTFVAKSSKKSK